MWPKKGKKCLRAGLEFERGVSGVFFHISQVFGSFSILSNEPM